MIRVVAFAILGGVAGFGLGSAAADLSNKPGATPGSGTSTAAFKTAPRTTGTSSAAKAPRPGLRIAILSTVLHPAAQPEGQRLQRARLGVGVRVTNRGTRPITLARPRLRSGDATVAADPAAEAVAGALLRPIAPGASARGILRFETFGAFTARLTSARPASLRIGGRTFALRVRIGTPAS